MQTIYNEIGEERKRQDAKWGQQNHPSMVDLPASEVHNEYGIPNADALPEFKEEPGEVWARVELMGHVSHMGRLAVAYSYTQIEVPQRDGTFQNIIVGPLAIYQVTPMSKKDVLKALFPVRRKHVNAYDDDFDDSDPFADE